MLFNGNQYNIKIWDGETKIGSLVSIDTETELVNKWTETPDMIVGSAYAGSDNVYLFTPAQIGALFNIHKGSSLIYHNAPFDMDVLSKSCETFDYYKYYDTNRVFDTGVLYRLYHLAINGWSPRKFSLALLCKEYLDLELEKSDVRVTFGQFKDKCLSKMPLEYQEYAAKDAIATYKCYLALRTKIGAVDVKNTLLSMHIQVKGDLALQHIYKNGIEFDLKRRDRWLRAADKRLASTANRLATWGWVRGIKGNKDIFEGVLKFLGISQTLPRTEDGCISSKASDLEPYRHLAFIDDYIRYCELEKESSFIRNMSSNRIHPRYTLLMNTGRTSCSGGVDSCNIQQLPRSGAIRSMFISKPEHVLVDIDYSSIELAILAQVNLAENGFSKMAELINSGECLHYNTATEIYKKDKKDITKSERQFSKIPNFGFAANMSPTTFIEYCKGYGVDINIERSTEIKDIWINTYPEMRKFFQVNGKENSTTLTGRIRGKCWYTAYLNTKFQGLAADGLKLAMYNIDKAGYTIVAEIHDQIIVETHKDGSKEVLNEVSKIMVESMEKLVTDVKITVEGQIVTRFCK